LAGVLAGAAVVAGLATALALTGVLALAIVVALVLLVFHHAGGGSNGGLAGVVRGMEVGDEAAGEEARDGGACEDRLAGVLAFHGSMWFFWFLFFWFLPTRPARFSWVW